MPFAIAPDGARLHYEMHGQGHPLLLLSGQAFDRTMWHDVQDDFAKHFLVITCDYRGTGDSDKPEHPPYSTPCFAHDVVSILDHAKVAKAHVYGYSMGGRVAQWLAIAHPERVATLVLGATTPGNAHGVPRPAAVDALLSSGDGLGLLDALVSAPWRAANPTWRQRMALRSQQDLPEHAQRMHYQASEAHEAWHALPCISAPTLVIHGSADQVNLVDNATLLAQRIPHAQLCLIEGARHGYFWEHRTQANTAVIDFLRAQR